ncbi:hypothetical protein FRC00_009753 [Tulasnella sp. 408]|nr:hypothetical protein FRC00_009753 [Tulasnella sp. 408]
MASLLLPPDKDRNLPSWSSTDEHQGSSFGSETDEKAVGQPSERPRWSSRPSKHRLVGFIPTIIVLMITLGFVVIIVGFLLGMQYAPGQGGQGFSAAIKHGYFVLNENKYGMLLRLMGSSSITAIGDGCLYAARSRTRPRLPRLFKQALSMSITIWVLARLVGLADLWLHTTSKAIPILQPIPDTSNAYMFAAQFNDTICPAERAQFPHDGSSTSIPALYPCFLEFHDFVFMEDWPKDVGFGVMANESSSAWSVITLADEADLAILVPGPAIDTRNTSYTASTIGIRADCTSLNSLCARDQSNFMTTDCSQAGYPLLPAFETSNSSVVDAKDASQIKDYIFGIVNGQLAGAEFGDAGITSPLASNPANMAVQLRWQARNEGATGDARGAAADSADSAIDLEPSPTLYAGCSVSFFNVTARLDGERNAWSLVDSTPSSREFTTTLWLPTVYQYATEYLANDLLTIARTQNKYTVMAALNQHLARLMLGAAAGYFAPAKATDVDRLIPTLLGQYPVAPVLAFIALLCLYALLTLLAFLSSWWTADQTIVPPFGESADVQERSMLSMTQRWLTSPIPLVGAAFPRYSKRDEEDGLLSVERQQGRMVYDGNMSNVRLGVGLTNEGFGIWERGAGRRTTRVEEL